MTASPTRVASRHQFAIEIDADRRALRLIGELDSVTAPCVLAVATTFLAESPGDLTLDLGSVTFADSALRTAIIKLRADNEAAAAHLWLVNHSAAIKRLFLAGGAIDLLGTRPTVAP